MRVGIDLDNTLVCYDELFAQLAVEANLLPPNSPRRKQAIRDYLRTQGQEEQWTALQGLAYGERMCNADAFPGAEEFLRGCVAARIQWWIISHRSRFPYSGNRVDLHDAARNWLKSRGLITADDDDRLCLELTYEQKLRRIAELKCDVFIDDLAEMLTNPSFPLGVRRILFDPGNQNVERPEYERVQSWQEISRLLGIL